MLALKDTLKPIYINFCITQLKKLKPRDSKTLQGHIILSPQLIPYSSDLWVSPFSIYFLFLWRELKAMPIIPARLLSELHREC